MTGACAGFLPPKLTFSAVRHNGFRKPGLFLAANLYLYCMYTQVFSSSSFTLAINAKS